MRGSQFAFGYVQLMYYKCHKINVNREWSHIDSPDWIKSKTAKINSINKKDNKCFQYVVTVALNYEGIKKDPQKIKKIKPFINEYNYKGINVPSEKDNWKKIVKNNVTIALNVLYAKKEKVYPAYAYISQQNSNREKHDFKRRKTMSLSWRKKTVSIIKNNNIKELGSFLLSELPAFF